MPSTESRLATVENELKHIRRDVEEMKGLMGDLLATQKGQRSFIAGIVFTVSAIWAVIVAAITIMKNNGG